LTLRKSVPNLLLNVIPLISKEIMWLYAGENHCISAYKNCVIRSGARQLQKTKSNNPHIAGHPTQKQNKIHFYPKVFCRSLV